MSGSESTSCYRCPAREPDLWDAAAVAERFGLSLVLVRQLVAYRAIPHVRLDGGRVRFRPREVDAWAVLCGRQPRPASADAVVISLDDYRDRRKRR